MVVDPMTVLNIEADCHTVLNVSLMPQWQLSLLLLKQ